MEWDRPPFKYRKPSPSQDNLRIPTRSWDDREKDYGHDRKTGWDDPKFVHNEFNNYSRDHYPPRRENYFSEYGAGEKSPRYRDMHPLDSRNPIRSDYHRENLPPKNRFDVRQNNVNQISRTSPNDQYHGYNSPISPRRPIHQTSSQTITEAGQSLPSQSMQGNQSSLTRTTPPTYYGGSNVQVNGQMPPFSGDQTNKGGTKVNQYNPMQMSGQKVHPDSQKYSLQTPIHTTPPSQSPKPGYQIDNEINEKRKNFKSYAGAIVVNRLSRYFHQGEINSKDDFKQLSRHAIRKLLDKEHPHYRRDRNTEPKIVQFVESYFEKFKSFKQKNQPIEKWFSSLSPI